MLRFCFTSNKNLVKPLEKSLPARQRRTRRTLVTIWGCKEDGLQRYSDLLKGQVTSQANWDGREKIKDSQKPNSLLW